MSFNSEVQRINTLTKALKAATSAAHELADTVQQRLHDGSNAAPPTPADAAQGSARGGQEAGR
jgi:hypothetical protein